VFGNCIVRTSMKIFAAYLSPRQIPGKYRDHATTVSFQILSGSSASYHFTRYSFRCRQRYQITHKTLQQFPFNVLYNFRFFGYYMLHDSLAISCGNGEDYLCPACAFYLMRIFFASVFTTVSVAKVRWMT